MSIVLGLATFFLIAVAVFLILVVLAQKAKSDGGMGAAMGGGMAEAAFGADTSNVLSRWTIRASIVFFVLTFALYLGRIYERKHAAAAAGSALPTINTSAPAPAMPASPPVTVPLAPPPNAGTPTATTPAPVQPAKAP